MSNPATLAPERRSLPADKGSERPVGVRVRTIRIDPPHGAPHAEPHIAPLRGWRRLAADWCRIGSATLIAHGLGVIGSLALRMLVSPAQMGIWHTARLLISYGNYANLGTSKGALREFNIATGRHARHNPAIGCSESAENLQGADRRKHAPPSGPAGRRAGNRNLDLAFTVNTATSLLYAAGLIAGACLIDVGSTHVWHWRVALLAAALLAVGMRYLTFHVSILRAAQEFSVTARLTVIEAVVTLLAGVAAVSVWGWPGLYAAAVVTLIASLGYVLPRAAVRLSWYWSRRRLMRLAAAGLPILAAGLLWSVLKSMDRFVILACLENCEHQLGCYSVALLACGALCGLGSALATAAAPRYGELFGATDDRRAAARLAARTSQWLALVMCGLVTVAMLIGPPLLSALLPSYRAGLPALVWLVPGAMLLTLAMPCSHYLIAVRRQNWTLPPVVVAIGVAWFGSTQMLDWQLGLAGVGAAMLIAQAAYYALLLAVSLWPELSWRDRLRYATTHVAAAVPVALTLVWLQIRAGGAA
jgi:O-antigen/teichoic acid export membrane protein